MHRVLLALSDLGLGIQLQESLEGRGVPVRLDGAAATGPTAAHQGGTAVEDVVVLDADHLGNRLGEVADAWRRIDPAPALLALGSTTTAAESAAAARCQLLGAGDDADAFLRAAAEAMRLRFAGSMTRGLARRALELTQVGEPIADAAQIVGAARALPVEVAKEALRWHAKSYVCASPEMIASLREVRALTIPEVEFVAHLDGTFTVQTLVKAGPIDGWHAARLLWSLTSVGATVVTPEPCDVATPRRRALTMIRRHLRARQARLEKGTFYDVLEVTPAVEAEDVETAYEGVGRRFAPQALASYDLADLAGVPDGLWLQVEKARSVMHDMSARGRYNDWLQSRWGELRTRWAIESGAANAAVDAWQRGQRALGEGDVHRAVGELAAAARNHPGTPTTRRTWRGRATAPRAADPRRTAPTSPAASARTPRPRTGAAGRGRARCSPSPCSAPPTAIPTPRAGTSRRRSRSTPTCPPRSSCSSGWGDAHERASPRASDLRTGRAGVPRRGRPIEISRRAEGRRLMRVALISDLHGNELALAAVLRAIADAGADRVVCLGDTATLGARPREVLAMLRDAAIPCIIGNHDEFLLDPPLVRSYTEAPVVVDAVDWCRAELPSAELDFVRTFVPELTIDLGGATLRLFHGSPRSNMEDLLATTPADELDAALAGRTGDVLAGGHTHLQLLRQHRGALLVNPGSVGMPFREHAAGKVPVILPRAEFAIVAAGSVTLHRVDLPRAALRAQAESVAHPLRAGLAAQYA